LAVIYISATATSYWRGATLSTGEWRLPHPLIGRSEIAAKLLLLGFAWRCHRIVLSVWLLQP
jgi:hypothetical protein